LALISFLMPLKIFPIENPCSPGLAGGAVSEYTAAPTTTNAMMMNNSRFPIDLPPIL
jgi:hypothetical protein